MQKQKLLSAEQITRLRKFNRNAAELLDTQFVKDMTTEKMSINFSYKYDAPGSNKAIVVVDRKGHSTYDFRAISTYVRLFLRDGSDKISLRQIARLYKSLPIDPIYQTRIDAIRKQVNNHLKDNIWAFYLQPAPTYDTLVKAFVYGLFLHMDNDKLRLIEDWEKDPKRWQEACFNFEHFLRGLVVCMQIVRKNNEAILELHA
jgi:hypothetical protein